MEAKNYKVLLFLLLIVLCSSCNEKPVGVNSFDIVEKVVVYDSIFADKDVPLGSVRDMSIANNILVLRHINDDYQFSFIDVAKRKMVSRWGTVGEGPDEFIDFGSDFFVRDSLLVFLTSAKKEINYVSLPDILSHRQSISIRKEKYPYNVDFRPRKICPVNDKKIAIGSFSKGLFGILDANNEIIDTSFDLPFLCDEVQNIDKGGIFQSLAGSNNRKNRFVLSILSSDIFEIYEMTDTGVYKIYTSTFQHVPQIWKKGERYAIDYDKSIAGLMKMAVSNEFICFTYSSQSYTEASKSGKVSNEVLCFDWNGEKIKKYILPFSISNICLDNNYIYAIRYVDDETVIYRFKL